MLEEASNASTPPETDYMIHTVHYNPHENMESQMVLHEAVETPPIIQALSGATQSKYLKVMPRTALNF